MKISNLWDLSDEELDAIAPQAYYLGASDVDLIHNRYRHWFARILEDAGMTPVQYTVPGADADCTPEVLSAAGVTYRCVLGRCWVKDADLEAATRAVAEIDDQGGTLTAIDLVYA